MRFYVLDGWRGVCACLVALFHLKVISHIYGGHFDDNSYGGDFSLGTFIHNSWLFVDFFFVLSGFIITHSLGGRLEGAAALVSFAIRRFGRLWPTHLVMVAAILGYRLLMAPAGWETLAVGSNDYPPDIIAMSAAKILALVHALPGGDTLWADDFFDINPPSWSISVELWIYLGFGLLLMVRWGRPLVIGGVAAVGAFILYWWVGQIGATFGFGVVRGVFGFFTGALVYWLYQLAARRERPWPALAWAEVPAAAGVAVFVTMVGPNEWSLFGPLVFGLAVWVFAFEAGPVSRLMLTGPVRKLGDLSYTVYMTHSLIALMLADALVPVQRWLGVDYSFPAVLYGEPVVIRSFPNDFAADAMALVYLGLVVAAAAAMSRWVEVPCRDWFAALARRGAPAVIRA